MSRAFIKEDVEIVERSKRQRSASGLPPGALNYLTADGARVLRTRLAELTNGPERDLDAIAHLERTLAQATIVEPQARPEAVVFGASVTLQTATDELRTYRIVGVDEVHMRPGNVSWVSAIGKALLGAEPGQRVNLPSEEKPSLTVVKIE